ncbi:MAG: 50S ribosomal protein L25/general stress protein Ctc [Actinomycetia bacterium]|nr:50S ribosomal protein L25/general stress protein Ctc [Actinomycetes bacterium]
MAEIRMDTQPRTEFGKGAARRVRRSGWVPAVVYGHGTEPTHVSLPEHDLMLALKAANVLLELQIEGQPTLVLPKSVQRDPVRSTLEHVDLVIVKRGEKVVVDVPVTITGKVAADGLVELVSAALSVETEATHIPTEILVSVDDVPVGSSVRAGEVALPAGTTLAADPDSVVVMVTAPQAAEEAAEAVEGAAEGAAEGAEGAVPAEPAEA